MKRTRARVTVEGAHFRNLEVEGLSHVTNKKMKSYRKIKDSYLYLIFSSPARARLN